MYDEYQSIDYQHLLEMMKDIRREETAIVSLFIDICLMSIDMVEADVDRFINFYCDKNLVKRFKEFDNAV